LDAPSVAADADAKMITVTADTSYHTGADVVTAAANAGLTGLLGGWTFTAESDDSLTATTAVGIGMGTGTKGRHDCYVVLAGSEPFSINPIATGNLSTTVDGLSVTTPTRFAGANTTVIDDSIVLSFPNLESTGATIIEIEGMTDAAGTVASDFTVSLTL
jgi:hypothetical protein